MGLWEFGGEGPSIYLFLVCSLSIGTKPPPPSPAQQHSGMKACAVCLDAEQCTSSNGLPSSSAICFNMERISVSEARTRRCAHGGLVIIVMNDGGYHPLR